MMYNEFLEISGEDYNITTGDHYMNDIEPVYQCSPETMFKDKRDFVNWWKKNKAICKWFCDILRRKNNMQKELQVATYQQHELEASIMTAKRDNEELLKEIEAQKEYIDELEKSREAALYAMQLRIAFAPDKFIEEMRLRFFPKYEEAKRDAVNQGIIKG